MLLIPAIDIKDGKCVRLKQGRMDEVTVYADDPLEMAARWVDEGARRLHVVDLDGALAGEPVNAKIVRRITQAFPHIPIQIGGGIRHEDTIQAYLNTGVSYVIIGTRAVTTPHFVADACLEFPGHIIVGLDAKDGKVATEGWSKLSHHDVNDLAKHFENDGVVSIIFTDISRDGMMQSINSDATLKLCQDLAIPVIASGGISSLEDIRSLSAVASEGIEGAIIGKALYEGTLDFSAAQTLADRMASEASGS